MKHSFCIRQRYQLFTSLAVTSLLAACVQSVEQPRGENIDRVTEALEQVVFFDDFSQGLSADKWIETGEGDWNTESLVSSNGYPSDGSGSPAAHSDNCDTSCSIELAQPIDLSSAQSARLRFSRFISSYLDAGEYLAVQLSDGNTWNPAPSSYWTDGDGDDSQWHTEEIPLTDYLQSSNFSVRFVTKQSSSYEHVHVDDVQIIVDSEGVDPPCGDDICDPSESCETCPDDCGCSPSDELFFDSFEDLSQWSNTGPNSFNTESLHATADYPDDASGSPATHADSCRTECVLVLLDGIDLSQTTSATLSFLRFVDSSLDSGEYLAIDLFDGSVWDNNVFYWTDGNGDDNRWHPASRNLSNYIGTSDFRVRIRSKSSWSSEHVHIDDLRVTAEDSSSTGFEISGYVRDNQNPADASPIAAVTVTASGAQTYQAVTDSNGKYTIEDIANGQYTVTATRAGYVFNPDKRPIIIDGDTVSMSSLDGTPVSQDIVTVDPNAIDFVGGTYECSIPSYQPWFWNADGVAQTNNCYNYATNVVSDERWGQPGYAQGYDAAVAMVSYAHACVAYREGAIWDGIEYIGQEEICPNNKTKLALFTDLSGELFHWFREDTNGTWSHKPGDGNATNLDIEGNIIYDVRTMPPLMYFDQFCGYFCACSSTAQGQGHEYISGPN